ncbi:MAG: IS1595 family transposase [Oscillospiraceae bacterium]|jgi:transposase-like protein|nr:IS1595 family transposase [Oscillospiraceae bacterium]
MSLTHNTEGEPIGFAAFAAKYATEEACYEKLYEVRKEAGFCCPKCGCTDFYLIKKRKLYQCKACRHQTSLIVGTAMEGTHLPLKKWFWAMYLAATDKRGVSALWIQKQLHMAYNSAWFLMQRIRQMMGMREENYMLMGIISFEDTAIGGAKPHPVQQSRGRRKARVLVGMSKTAKGYPRYAKFVYVKDLKANTIRDVTEKAFEPGAKLENGACPSYRKHIKEKHLTAFAAQDASKEDLLWLRTVVSNIKLLFNGTYHGLDARHMQRYLNEAAYRFNRRKMEDCIFDRLLTAMPGSAHITYRQLTRGPATVYV